MDVCFSTVYRAEGLLQGYTFADAAAAAAAAASDAAAAAAAAAVDARAPIVSFSVRQKN